MSRQQELDKADNLKVDDVLEELIKKLFENPEYSFNTRFKTYNNLLMKNKPPLSYFEAELVNYKSKMKAKINAKWDEKERKEALKARIDKLKYHDGAASRAFGVPNGTVKMKSILEDLNEEDVIKLEQENILIEKELSEFKAKYDEIDEASKYLDKVLKDIKKGSFKSEDLPEIIKALILSR